MNTTTPQHILDGAPEGATHIDCMDEYWLHDGENWFLWLESCEKWKRIVNYEPFLEEFKVKPL